MNKEFRVNLSQLKKRAFTLAETLIVMGIIGVVAALTLPNLNSSTGEKEKVAKLQKIYSNLQDAFGRAEAVYGPYDEWCSGLSDNDCKKRFFERVSEFMKYSKVCTVSDACTLFNKGSSYSDGVRTPYAVVLQDGSVVGFATSGNMGYVLVDIDGMEKGPNQASKDYFQFTINPEEKLHINRQEDNVSSSYFAINANPASAWVIKNNNMDYLKTDSSGMCPDGKTVLNWTTNTTCK